MATVCFSSSYLLLLLALSSLLLSCSAQSPACKSQTFSNRQNFSNCLDLPHLNSTLHWTFDSQSLNLTLAFTAPPAQPGGWIAWGINPTDLKMPGTQALVAYPDARGKMTAKTFNISSYSSPMEGKILYDVFNLTAEVDGDGRMKIFATVQLPKGTTKINQVWQVGPGVTGSMLQPHALELDNKNAANKLNLVEGLTSGASVNPPSGAPSPTGTDGGSSGNKIGNKNGSVVLSLFFLLLCSSIWG